MAGRPKGSKDIVPRGATVYSTEYIEKEADALLEYAKKTALPFECDFSSKRGYHIQRMSEWANSNPYFSETLKAFKSFQRAKIIKKGFRMKNSSFAIFTLKNVAGWRDSQDVKHDFSDNFMDKFKDFTTDQVKARINELLGSKTV